MGPSPTGDGENAGADVVRGVIDRFNGAVANRRRRGLHEAEKLAKDKLRFNGAVANRRRRVGSDPHHITHQFASMGPSPTGDGERFDASGSVCPFWGFNGAVANRRRRGRGENRERSCGVLRALSNGLGIAT